MELHHLEAAPTAVHSSECCTAPACLYGMVRALIDELSARRHSAKFGIAQDHQLAALAALDEQLLAVLMTEPAARTSAMFEELHRRFQRAQHWTDRGTPIEELLTLAEPRPWGRFRLDIPSLCWAAVAGFAKRSNNASLFGANPGASNNCVSSPIWKTNCAA